MTPLGTAARLGALALVVTGLLTACGGPRTGQSATGPTGVLSTAPAAGTGPAMAGPALPPGSEPVAGTQVDAHGLPAGFPREVWTSDGGRVLGLYGEAGGCLTVRAQADVQTGTQVTVRLVQLEPLPVAGHACSEVRTMKPLSVPLASPLGNRTVVLQLTIARG